MYEKLGGVREPVALSSQEVLDSAQRLVVEQGYEIVQRTATVLTAVRRKREGMFGHSLLNLIVVAQPRSEGGVQVTLKGNDKEGVQERQAEWSAWAEGLPKVSEVQEHEQTGQGVTEPGTTEIGAEDTNETPDSGEDDPKGNQDETPEAAELQQAQAGAEKEDREQAPTEELGRWASVASWDRQSQVAAGKHEDSVAPPASPTGTDVDHRTSEQAQQDDRTVRGSDTIRLRIAELQKELDKALEAEGKNRPPVKETAARDQRDTSDTKLESGPPVRDESEEAFFAKVIETESLRIVNKQSEVRGLFAANEDDSSRLAIFDSNGSVGAMLTVDDDSAILVLADESGQPRVRLAAGSSDHPALDLVDSSGQLRVRITLEDGGSPALTLVDSKGTPRAAFKEDSGTFLVGFVDADQTTRGTFHMDRDGSPQLMLRDKTGSIRCMVASDADGSPTIALSHEDEEIRVALSVGDDGLPSLLLVDDNQNPRAALRILDDGSPSLSLMDKWGNPRRL